MRSHEAPLSNAPVLYGSNSTPSAPGRVRGGTGVVRRDRISLVAAVGRAGRTGRWPPALTSLRKSFSIVYPPASSRSGTGKVEGPASEKVNRRPPPALARHVDTVTAFTSSAAA